MVVLVKNTIAIAEFILGEVLLIMLKQTNKKIDECQEKTVPASKIKSWGKYEKNPLSKYLVFEELPSKPKTRVFEVVSFTTNEKLGIIKWNPAWRQYCFFTTNEFKVIYSTGCMTDIIKFVKSLNEKHKQARQEAKAE